MFKLPDNIKYRVFDNNFKASTGKYLVKNEVTSIEEVHKNRNAICEALDCDRMAILHQIHGVDVFHAKSSTLAGEEPQMDASYTTEKGVVLAIQTADCVPVLLADKNGKVIGAAHCGWKSAIGNILEKLVEKMEKEGASKFMAIIGPSIHQESYEVDKQYFDRFLKESIENSRFFIPSSKHEHFMFDLPAYVKWKLSLLSINDVYHIYEDTYTNSDKYPSYRRSCHAGETYKSCILSTIVLN